MTLKTHRPAQHWTFHRGAVCAVVAVLMVLGSPARALDGRVDVRSTHQEGRGGAQAYETDSLREVYSLTDQIDFGHNLLLNLNALARRETYTSRTFLAASESERTTMLPGFALSYRSARQRLGLNGRASRSDEFRPGVPDERDEQFELNFWWNADFGQFLVDAIAQESVSWRYAAGNDRETREHLVGANVTWDASQHDQWRYRYSRSQRDAINLGLESTFLTNSLQYRGDHDLGERTLLSVSVLANHFRQREHRADGDRVYVPPLEAAASIDDTPEFLDPLETDPVAVPGLIDTDRNTPTNVAIGDEAPAGREFGGDYRNVIVDFGEPQEMASLVLYVDRVVSFPQLMDWTIHVGDDPEGRDWETVLPPAGYDIRYLELENGVQGWSVTFAAPVTHRRIKLVNTKRGPVEPVLFVTELEVYRPGTDFRPDSESTVLSTRINSQLEHRLTDRLTGRYSLSVNDRQFEGNERDLRTVAHVAGLNYRFDQWVLAGAAEFYTLRGGSRQDTDASTQSVSLVRSGRPAVTPRFSYSHTVDKSFTNRHETHSAGADLTWRMAPQLTFSQKVSFGLRDDPLLDDLSRSWVIITELIGTPRPSLTCELRRADRWVDQEAGAGFTSFNDTELQITWSVLPRIQYVGLGVYQQRDEEDWFYRNTLSWSVLEGGSMELRVYGTDQQDTRTDLWQRGGGASLDWKPRPTLRLAAGIEQSRVRQFDDRNDPFSYRLRGNWSF